MRMLKAVVLARREMLQPPANSDEALDAASLLLGKLLPNDFQL